MMGCPIRLIVPALGIALPWVVLAIWELCAGRLSVDAFGIAVALCVCISTTCLYKLCRSIEDLFNTLANIVGALRHGDYTQRIRGGGTDPVGMLMDEINQLADAMQQNRLAQTEEIHLLQNLIDKLDMAAFVLDEESRLTMLNPALSRLLDRPSGEVVGESAESLGLGTPSKRESESTVWMEFPRRSSRFMIHRTDFRQSGKARHLILLTDLRTPLREEERSAWKRLIRVMGHELNNSLTPIISLTRSLKGRIPASGMPAEKAHAFDEALDVISGRAEHLNHFMQDYSRLAKLPEPRREKVSVTALVGRVAKLEDSGALSVEGGPECLLNVDTAQVENVLINVVKNAMEASANAEGHVRIGWTRDATEVTINIDDDGPGIQGTENLFVPFYSTNPGGSGIGLVLSRELAEANGGTISLTNRAEGGCRAKIILPIALAE